MYCMLTRDKKITSLSDVIIIIFIFCRLMARNRECTILQRNIQSKPDQC